MTSFYKRLSPVHLAVLDTLSYVDAEGNREEMLTRINVPEPYRGQGHASELLRQCCNRADTEQLTLSLVIIPYPGEGGLNYTQLKAFYTRHGFVDDGSGMIRPPDVTVPGPGRERTEQALKGYFSTRCDVRSQHKLPTLEELLVTVTASVVGVDTIEPALKRLVARGTFFKYGCYYSDREINIL